MRGGGGGNLLASFLVLQLNDSFTAFLFCLLRASPVVLGRTEWPDSGDWLVPAPVGQTDPQVVVPVHPLITLMLHLLFTFVFLYIGL